MVSAVITVFKSVCAGVLAGPMFSPLSSLANWSAESSGRVPPGGEGSDIAPAEDAVTEVPSDAVGATAEKALLRLFAGSGSPLQSWVRSQELELSMQMVKCIEGYRWDIDTIVIAIVI